MKRIACYYPEGFRFAGLLRFMLFVGVIFAPPSGLVACSAEEAGLLETSGPVPEEPDAGGKGPDGLEAGADGGGVVDEAGAAGDGAKGGADGGESSADASEEPVDAGPGLADGGAPPSDASAPEFAELLPLASFLVDSILYPGDPGYPRLVDNNIVSAQPFKQAAPTPCGEEDISFGALFDWSAPNYGTLSLAFGPLPNEAITHAGQFEAGVSRDGGVDVDAASSDPSSAGNRALLVQGECFQLTSTKACTEPRNLAAHVVPVSQGQKFCIVLGTETSTTVQANFSPARCGDNAINPPDEECDFGDTESGDGCDEQCKFEPVPEEDFTDSCPGESFGIKTTLAEPPRGHTIGYGDSAPPTCGALRGGRDRTYMVTAQATGVLSVTLRSDDFDSVLAVFRTCADSQPKDLLACSDGPLRRSVETIRLRVEEGESYHVVVDGYTGREFGNFELDLELVAEGEARASSQARESL